MKTEFPSLRGFYELDKAVDKTRFIESFGLLHQVINAEGTVYALELQDGFDQTFFGLFRK